MIFALRLQFDPADIPSLAAHYQYEDDLTVQELGRQARERGWYTRDAFLETCEWKSSRIRPKVARNSSADIERATGAALATRDPSHAIAALRTLYGVDWAVGSVFLHLAHRDPFPILDYRALEALGVPRGQVVTNRRWLDYVMTTRALAAEARVNSRTLDRALWQWSKERDLPGEGSLRRQPSPAAKRVVPRIPPAVAASGADVVILGCVSSKRRGRAPAKDIYISPLWRKRRTYAEATGKRWVIFSAKHGILHPDEVIEWYDVALAQLPSAERAAKGRQAASQLEAMFGPLEGMTFEIHAGSAYANALVKPLRARGADLRNGLEGLSIGYQLQWYGRGASHDVD